MFRHPGITQYYFVLKSSDIHSLYIHTLKGIYNDINIIFMCVSDMYVIIVIVWVIMGSDWSSLFGYVVTEASDWWADSTDRSISYSTIELERSKGYFWFLIAPIVSPRS